MDLRREKLADDLVDDFVLDLKLLISDYGREAVVDALRQVSPRLLQKEALKLQESRFRRRRRDRSTRDQKRKEKVNSALAPAAVGAGAVGSTVGGVTGNLAGKLVSKAYDQDVNIDGISTSDVLNVTDVSQIEANEMLVALIKQTNELLANLIDTTGVGLKMNDDSTDFLAAALTGDSLASVQGAQATQAPNFAGAFQDIDRAQVPTRPPRAEPEEDEEDKK